jgi:tRNA threonylcarbamoyladenosine biosynthesis protein TsaB
MATAKALAQGLSQTPVVAVPTLEAMAWQVMGQDVALSPMLNARREQIYTGLYRWKQEIGDGDNSEAMSLKEIFASRQRGKKDRLPAGAGECGWTLESLVPPEAVGAEAWGARLKELGQKVYLLGDSAAMYREIWRRELGGDAVILPPVLGLCRAGFVALAAKKKLDEDKASAAEAWGMQDFYSLKPIYLRGI